jgi:quercetin dioxygenase-like cupin family protein
MKSIIPAILIATIGVGHSALAQQATPDVEGIIRAGARPAAPGSPNFFTGQVSVRPVVQPQAPGRTSIGAVTFQPGARSNWHTHPAGQALYVSDGCGWTQREGGPITRICSGDAVYVPAGVKHWHGATATTTMTHLAITETVDGRNVDWMEPVSDAQYRAGPGADK